MAEDQIKGVYSTTTKSHIGTGMTRRATESKRYWVAWDDEEGDGFIVQPLNKNLIPTGQKRRVTPMEFRERFRLEPDFFVDPDATQVRHLWRGEARVVSGKGEEEAELPAARGGRGDQGLVEEEHSERPEQPVELNDRVDLDETVTTPEDAARERLAEIERSARADFGLGLVTLRQGNPRKAKRIFEDLAGLDTNFEPRHKHMFNEFGIGLRKSRLLDVALKHYQRALELSPDDENLHHNVARVHFERDELGEAVDHLQRALALNPDLEPARRFLQYIRKNYGRHAAVRERL
jgi:tetratricopeptide (TPR) repeat protein